MPETLTSVSGGMPDALQATQRLYTKLKRMHARWKAVAGVTGCGLALMSTRQAMLTLV
jgi:hypothetical protein